MLYDIVQVKDITTKRDQRKLFVMARTNLKDRNPFSEKVNYDRATQLKILRAQLTYLCGTRKPDILERSYISAASVLILAVHDLEQDFENDGTLSSKYETRLRSLENVLKKLGLKVKGPGKSSRGKGQDKDLDLSNIINSEDG